MTRVAFPVAARAERGPSVSTPPPAAVSARGYKMPIRAALLFFCRIVCVALVWSISVIAACLLSGCGLLPQRRDWDLSRAEWRELRDYMVATRLIEGMEAPEKQ